MKIFTFGILITILGAGTAIGNQPVEVTNDQVASVEKEVSDRMLDPQSAQFGTITSSTDGKHTFYCGMVNAKTRGGGYGGFGPFFIMYSSQFHPPMLVENWRPESITGVCRAYNVTIENP